MPLIECIVIAIAVIQFMWLISVISPNNSSGKADPGLTAGEPTGEPDK